MNEEEVRKTARTQSEFRETQEAFAAVRAGFVARLLATKHDEQAERERLYLAVGVLDQVQARMLEVVKNAGDTKLIEEFADAFREKG